MLTQARLKELLYYDPELGWFMWRVTRPHAAPGSVPYRPTRLGYLLVCVAGRAYSAHRLAWFYVFGTWPRELDHINGLKDDNRIENLRECSRAQNGHNAPLTKSNTSGFKGAYRRTGTDKWMSKIRVDGRLLSLGDFKHPVEAAVAYDIAARKFFGEFALTNKMLGLL